MLQKKYRISIDTIILAWGGFKEEIESFEKIFAHSSKDFIEFTINNLNFKNGKAVINANERLNIIRKYLTLNKVKENGDYYRILDLRKDYENSMMVTYAMLDKSIFVDYDQTRPIEINFIKAFIKGLEKIIEDNELYMYMHMQKSQFLTFEPLFNMTKLMYSTNDKSFIDFYSLKQINNYFSKDFVDDYFNHLRKNPYLSVWQVAQEVYDEKNKPIDDQKIAELGFSKAPYKFIKNRLFCSTISDLTLFPPIYILRFKGITKEIYREIKSKMEERSLVFSKHFKQKNIMN